MEKRLENQGWDKFSVGFGISFLIACIINGLLIIAKESYAPLKIWMKSLSSHHWITHGIFVIVLFIIFGYIFSKTDIDKKIDADKISGLVIAGTILGGLIIAGFFFKHLFE
jgi:formate hydrogenlyase subunit 3/multisubunit Na+/H+ antiporter MnhD subunit